ncbi:hypothetical protein AK830_g5097 [Neonectria ditissima]|uniref:Heterokaryon incompatibility domain-containing protein n=1 Tax=Neonectria ditissima TaxID=78410 RepID=A0A0P7BEZ2_9HYPO|nr:hypothetical protein AK830_g5097 [Neonectria ditissima]
MESETTLQNRPTEGPPCLTIENGTLCSFCHESLNHPPADPGNHVRKLDDLLEAAEFCGYCALCVRSLEASAHALVEDGQDAAMKSHPLLQGVFDPSEVELQYVDLHDWIGGGIEQRIAWPRMGTIWATLDLVPASDSSLINMEPLASSDQSNTVWEGIKWWLSECTSEHDECRSHRDKSWKPSRLLHLGTPSQPMEIKLVEGKSTPDTAEYLTLSHCWGTVTPLRLTTDTIETFQSSIPIDNLPKTFLDACKTTRGLGYEYLWIDSLCIVQDDSANWAFEAGRMSSVYGNSFLTLAATAANDANQGLFCPSDQRDPTSWLPVRIRRDWGAQFAGDFYACDYRDWWTKLDNSPLNRRGWAFQERMLAPRVLHLGLEQVAFECPAMSACERLPFGNLGRVDGQMGGPGSKVKRFMAEAGENERKLGVDDILRQWNEMVRNYSHGQFGIETDKMVALTGVVDSFASLFHRHLKQISEKPQEGVTPDNGDALKQKPNNVEESDKPKQETLFVGGLWRPQMEMQLAWRATSKVQSQQLSGIAPPGFGRRPQTYVAPTWSWCSLNDTLVEPQQANPVDLLLTKVLEAKIDPATELPIAEKNSGLRYCCGPSSFLRLQCSQLPLAGFGRIHGLAFFDFETRQAPTRIESTNYWDIEYGDEALKADMPCIVPVFVDMTRVMRPVHGIILDQRSVQDSDEKYYVRLGAFVLEEADAIKAMWNALEKFDRFNPVGRLCDGMHRPAEDGYNYMKKDGVLQRVVCIR